MNIGKTVLAQLQECSPLHQFRRCMKRYDGNLHILTNLECQPKKLVMNSVRTIQDTYTLGTSYNLFDL